MLDVFGDSASQHFKRRFTVINVIHQTDPSKIGTTMPLLMVTVLWLVLMGLSEFATCAQSRSPGINVMHVSSAEAVNSKASLHEKF